MFKKRRNVSFEKLRKAGKDIAKKVDIRNRIQKGFGRSVKQMVEMHYDGPPFSFSYMDKIEQIDIDVKNDVDFTKTSTIDKSVIELTCSCGFQEELQVKDQSEKGIKKMIADSYADHLEPEHELVWSYGTKETPMDKDKRIKNPDPKKIRYYRIFSKKTARIKYLATYDQDLLAEAQQVKFTQTAGGSAYMRRFQILIMLFIFSLIEVITILSIYSSVPTYYSPVSTSTYVPSSSNAGYTLPIIIAIASAVIIWLVHTRDVSITSVKYLQLKPAPFKMQNKSIIPVVLANSATRDWWSYSSQVMHLSSEVAEDVYSTLQGWNDEQVEQLDRTNKIMELNIALMDIEQESRDLQKLDRDYREASGGVNHIQKYIIGGLIGGLSVFVVMFILGV